MVLFCQEISWQIFELKLVSPVPFFFLKEGAKRRKSRIHVPFFSDRNICNCNNVCCLELTHKLNFRIRLENSYMLQPMQPSLVFLFK